MRKKILFIDSNPAKRQINGVERLKALVRRACEANEKEEWLEIDYVEAVRDQSGKYYWESNYNYDIFFIHGNDERDIAGENNYEKKVKEGTYCIFFTGTEGQFEQRGNIVWEIKDEKLHENIKGFLLDWKKRPENPDFRILYEGQHPNISPLLPLHLSLQAFFGISKDENGGWVYLGNKKYCGEMRIKQADNIPPEFKKNFPNRNAFLLVDEAEWDFYASIFDKVMPQCKEIKANGNYNECTAEKEEYEGKIIGELFEFMLEIHTREGKEEDNLEIMKKWKKAFNSEYKHCKIKECDITKIKEKPESFVNCLREITAILANTCDNGTQECHKEMEVECDGGVKNNISATFAYKGRCKPERDDILKQMCKINDTELDKTRHCKLPNENGKTTSQYKILKEQIEKWGVKKAMVVIAGIEELAKVLTRDEE